MFYWFFTNKFPKSLILSRTADTAWRKKTGGIPPPATFIVLFFLFKLVQAAF